MNKKLKILYLFDNEKSRKEYFSMMKFCLSGLINVNKKTITNERAMYMFETMEIIQDDNEAELEWRRVFRGRLFDAVYLFGVFQRKGIESCILPCLFEKKGKLYMVSEVYKNGYEND